jgi:DNA replication and repair protein RecF
MNIEKVQVANFRNHAGSTLELSPGINVLVGRNAQGKTNLLEAVFLTCVGRGWRTNKDKEMINFASDAARVRTVVKRKFGNVEVEINLSRNAKKTIKINGIPVQRMGELMGQVNCVFFSPDELRLVKDAPADRRRFLDIDISQIDKAYFYGLLKYNKILLQRNALLKSRTEDIESGLDIWDGQLAKAGAFVIARRIDFVARLRQGVTKVHGFLTNEKEEICVGYERITEGAGDDGGLEILMPQLEQQFLAQLQASREKDVRLRTTSVGPHRDDLRITIDGKDVRHFASQGQQRTVALSLKLAELEIFREATGEMPVLLLDDVFSELDAERQARLVRALAKCQSIVTAVQFPDGMAESAKVFSVENGAIELKKV